MLELITIETMSSSASESCDRRRYFVCVIYEDTAYGIPENDSASMRSLALLQRLISLNKSVKDEPITRAVEIVGSGRVGGF